MLHNRKAGVRGLTERSGPFLLYQVDGFEDSFVAFCGVGEVAFVVVPCECYGTVFYSCGILHVDSCTAMYGDEDVAELRGQFLKCVINQYWGAFAFQMYLANMTIGEDAYDMLFENTQETLAVLDEARFRHREEGIFPHYTTSYDVSGLHFFWFKKRVS